MAHPFLLELNTRCWLRSLSDRAGRPVTLANVPDEELEHWSRLGLTHIWLMGVWSTGPRVRSLAREDLHLRRVCDAVLPGWQVSDIAGSPYAIAEYRVPLVLGGENGLADFRRRLRARSMRLILDFVPNHLGLDHPWVRERPELFVHSRGPRSEVFQEVTLHGPRWLAHGKDPYFPPWTDTVQVDYRLAQARDAMLGILTSIAARCDGVRCDMAMLLLQDVFSRTWREFPATDQTPAEAGEFWTRAIEDVKRLHGDFEFLGEVYWGLEARLQDLGFDFTYDKALYDKILGKEPEAISRHLLAKPAERLSAEVHFLENHDERRIAGALSLEEHRAAAALTLGLPGMRFLHEGQMEGARLRVPVQLARRPAEPPQERVAAIYESLLTLFAQTSVGRGRGELLRPVVDEHESWSSQVILVQWKSEGGTGDLLAVNLGASSCACFAPAPVPEGDDGDWCFEELLQQQVFVISGRDLRHRGVPVRLPAHGVAVYHYLPRGRRP